MARDWVKLATSMLFHGETQALPGEAFKAWVNLILLAGYTDDDGRVGPPDNVAYALHIPRATLDEHLAAMNGRITTDPDGSLRVRDWAEWQSPSERDRKRAYRARVSQTVPDCPSVSQTSQTVPDVPLKIRRDKIRQENNIGAIAPDVDRWACLVDAISASYGGKATRTRTGAVAAWAGNIIRVAGRAAGDDPDTATALWREWFASLDAAFVPAPDSAADKFGAWAGKRAARHDYSAFAGLSYVAPEAAAS